MLSAKAKALFAKLELDYEPVALKYMAVRPEGIEQSKEHFAFCEYVREAQKGKTFYISKENDACYGKLALGMIDPPRPRAARPERTLKCTAPQRDAASSTRRCRPSSEERSTMLCSPL